MLDQVSAQFDLSNGTFLGSVFAGCSFTGSPPREMMEAALLALAAERFAEMPTDVVPPAGRVPQGSYLPHAPNPLFVGRSAELMSIAAAL